MRRCCVPLFAVAMIGSAGCGDDQAPEKARALWERLQEEDYRSWARAPGFESPRSSRAAHDDRVIVYVNDVVSEALRAERLSAWPEGSIIVKEGLDGAEVTQVAAMAKEADGWFWVEWSPDGDSLFSGSPEICLGCHRSGDDWVRSVYLP